MGSFIGYDFERFFAGDYDEVVCVSRRFLWLRRHILPWTLRYETRHVPPHPHGLTVTSFPALDRIARRPHPSAPKEREGWPRMPRRPVPPPPPASQVEAPDADAHYEEVIKLLLAAEDLAKQCLQSCQPPALRMAMVAEDVRHLAWLLDRDLEHADLLAAGWTEQQIQQRWLDEAKQRVSAAHVKSGNKEG